MHPQIQPVQAQPMKLLTSSSRDDWRTPAQYVKAAREVMGGIDLDPASSPEANQTVQAAHIHTKEDDGLAQDWFGRVWLNPPYGKLNNQSLQGLFSSKLIQEFYAGRVTEAILLVNLYSGYQWFVGLYDFVWCVADHRIRFINPVTGLAGDKAKASSVFIYFGFNAERFSQVFSQFGYCGKLSKMS